MPSKQPVGTTKTTKALPKPGPNEQEEQQAPAARGGSSKADLFNSAQKEEGFDFPVGQYQAILVGCSVLKDGEKESIQFDFEVVEGEQEGKVARAWYNLFDKSGQPQRGAGFFKRDLEILGRDPIEYDDLKDGLRVLQDERLEVIIDVKKGTSGFTNVYLKGLAA